MQETRYLTKQLLIEFNNAAIREKRNKCIKEDFLESLPDVYYPVIFMMYHNNDEIRTRVIFDDKGAWALLDMSKRRYETLPVLKDNHNRDMLLTEDEMRKRMPYEGKEWVERKYIKPYRDPSFRNKILEAYDNKCAVCGINNKKILRAAHIKDAAKGGSEEVCNGLCLCTNHEIAFDRGDLKIKPDGEIVLFMEDNSAKNKYITLPNDKKNYPSKEYLKWKYENV